MSTISELIVKIGADNSGLNKGLQESKQAINSTFSDVSPIKATEGALSSVGDSVTGLIGKFNGMIALVAGGFGFSALIGDAVNAGAAVQELADVMGISAAEAGKFSKTIKIAGGDVGTVQSAMMRLGKSYQSNSAEGQKCRDTMARYGVSLSDANGKLLPVNEQLTALAKGFKTAQASGQQQEFAMNTLGVRGLALIPVLNDLAEAQERASQIEGIGMDPAQMKQMQMQMRQLDLQAGQLKIALGSVFASIFGDDIDGITKRLAALAQEFKENRGRIQEVATEIMKLVALYTALKTASKVANGAKNILAISGTSAAEGIESAGLTAQQERSIAKQEAMIARQAQREEAAYMKTVQAMEIAEEEKTALYTQYVVERERISMASQARIRAEMTTMYEETAAQEAAIAATTSTVTEANVAVSESYAGRAVAAEEAGTVEKEQNATTAVEATELALANDEVAASHVREAETAGAAEVAAANLHNTGKTGAAEHKTAVDNLSGAHRNAAVQVNGVTKQTGALAGMVGGIRTLTGAVWALAGGWMGVAMAIGYTIILSAERNTALAHQIADGVIVLDSGKTVKNNGDGTYVEVTDAGQEVTQEAGDSTGTADSYDDPSQRSDWDTDTENAGIQSPQERNDTQQETRNQNYSTLTPEEQAEAYGKDPSTAKYRETDTPIPPPDTAVPPPVVGPAAPSAGSVAAAAAAPKEEAPQTVTYEIPIGEAVAQHAQNDYGEGDKWMGTVTDNAMKQCDSWMADLYHKVGLFAADNIVNDDQFRNSGAYHSASDGYEPQAGDEAYWKPNNGDHYGVYLGNGMYRARNSKGGVKTFSAQEAQDMFGDVVGWGSISEAAKSQGIAQTVQSSTTGNAETTKAAKEQADAAKQMTQIFGEMLSQMNERDAGPAVRAENKALQGIATERQKIQKLADSGLITQEQIKNLNIVFGAYQKSQLAEAAKAWHDELGKWGEEYGKDLGAAYGDYEGQATAQFDAQIEKIKQDIDKMKKDIPQKATDDERAEAQNKINKLNDEQMKLAKRQLQQAQHEAIENRLKSISEYGDGKSKTNIGAVIDELNDIKSARSRMQYLEIEDQKKLAQEYVKIWDAAHGTIANNIGEISTSLYGSLADSIQEFVKGTQGAMSVVHSFGNAILSELTRIAANRLAGQFLSGILDSQFGSKNNHTYTIDTVPEQYRVTSAKTITPFADGGIVTAPTLGLIGEAGYKEAVVPLTDGNLRAMGGGSTGKVVVNITNNSDSKPRVAGSRYDSGLNAMILDVVIDGATRNVGGFGTNMKQALK